MPIHAKRGKNQSAEMEIHLYPGVGYVLLSLHYSIVHWTSDRDVCTPPCQPLLPPIKLTSTWCTPLANEHTAKPSGTMATSLRPVVLLILYTICIAFSEMVFGFDIVIQWSKVLGSYHGSQSVSYVLLVVTVWQTVEIWGQHPTIIRRTTGVVTWWRCLTFRLLNIRLRTQFPC